MGCSSVCSNVLKVIKEENHNTNYIQQKSLLDHSEPIPRESMVYILAQMKSCVCKIRCIDGFGTGFFCVIPFPDLNNLLPVLITNNHVLNKKDIEIGKEIIFTTNDEKNFYYILIDKERKVYTNEESYDITIIEIMEKDTNILENIFLEIDDQIFNSNIDSYNEIYNQKSIYLLHYPNGQKIEYSGGVIKNISIDNCDIQHFCSTKEGSSGSPIINLLNYKVIGIHKGTMEKRNWNLGSLIKRPIEEFNKLYQNKTKIDIFVEIFNKNNFDFNPLNNGIEGINDRINNEEESFGRFKDTMVINFRSQEENINMAIKCRGTDIFSRVEERFYNYYPEFKEANNHFLCKGNVISRFNTIKENKIKDGDIILIFKIE